MTKTQTYVEARSGMIEREPKPRHRGLNYVRAPKVLGQYFTDFLACYDTLTDIIKIGTNQLTFVLQFRKANGSASESGSIYYNWYSGATHTMQALEVAQ